MISIRKNIFLSIKIQSKKLNKNHVFIVIIVDFWINKKDELIKGFFEKSLRKLSTALSDCFSRTQISMDHGANKVGNTRGPVSSSSRSPRFRARCTKSDDILMYCNKARGGKASIGPFSLKTIVDWSSAEETLHYVCSPLSRAKNASTRRLPPPSVPFRPSFLLLAARPLCLSIFPLFEQNRGK